MQKDALTLAFLEKLAFETDDRKVAEASLEALMGIISAHYYCAIYGELKPRTIDVFHPGEGWLEPNNVLLKTMIRLGPNNPLPRFFHDNPQSSGCLVRSELIPNRIYKHCETYNELDRRLGVEDMVILNHTMPSGQFISLVCGRDRRYKTKDVETAQRFQRILSALPPFRSFASPLHSSRLKANNLGKLTNREREILHWIREGKRNSEIAAILGISHNTVRHHLESIYPKIGVESRTAAAILVGR